ncbi:hypothetical protein FBR05_08885 [Deltaproteobacteria bacterium PRO3]|nr:hypothetical protein [Deltaproteobacteria bacterium PRO3]
MRNKTQAALLLFLVGAVFGPVGDSFHVVSGTTDYPPNLFQLYFWRLPWWVPLIFGAAGVAIGMSHPQMDRWLGAPPDRPGSRGIGAVIFGVAAFLGIYAMTAFVPLKSGGPLDALIAASALAVWLLLDRTWQGVLLGMMTAVVGTVTEILLVRAGAFWYLPPKDALFGVGSWLPWLYFSASVAVGNLGRFLQNTSGDRSLKD